MSSVTTSDPPVKEEMHTVFAASFISATSATIFLIMPLFIGVMVDELDLSHEHAGFLASSYFGGYLFVCVSALFWIRRVNWRLLSVAGHLLLISSILAAAMMTNYRVLLVFFFLAGCGGGTLFSLCICILSETADPDKSFGFKLAAEQLVGASMLFLLPGLVISKWGYSGFCISLAAVFLTFSLCTFWIPDHPSHHDDENRERKQKSTIPVWLGLLCLMIFMAGLSGVWAFIERMASDNSIDAVNIGRALSYGVVGGACGAFLAAMTGDRFGRTFPLVIALALLSTALFILNSVFSMATFVPVCIALSGMWNFSLAYQMGIIASIDEEGGLTVLMSSALALGAVIGPALAGMTIEDSNYFKVNLFAFICIILTSLVFMKLGRLRTD